MQSSTLQWAEAVDSRTNEYVRRWMRHFPLLRATAIESWYEALEPASLPTLLRPLAREQRDLLIDEHWRRVVERPSRPPAAFDELILELEELVVAAQARSPVGASFVRLGFRAPTDSPTAGRGRLQVDGGPEALEVLLESARVFDDLCLAQECGYTPSLVVRPWLELTRGHELRGFVRGRRLVGLSQRLLDAPQPELIERGPELEALVRRRAAELAPRWPLDDLVVDFAVLDGQAWIVDLAPWLPWTDPALFSWGDDEPGEYSFRYLLPP